MMRICKTVGELREILNAYSDDTMLFIKRIDQVGYDNIFVIGDDDFTETNVKVPDMFDGDYNEIKAYETNPNGTIHGLKMNC